MVQKEKSKDHQTPHYCYNESAQEARSQSGSTLCLMSDRGDTVQVLNMLFSHRCANKKKNAISLLL